MLALVLLALLFMAVFAWSPVQRVLAMAVLRRSVDGGEMNFDEYVGLKVPPAVVDKKITAILNWTFSKTHGYTGKSAVKVYHAAYGDIFRAPIQKIEVVDPRRINGNPGRVLPWFPQLNRFILSDSGNHLSEAEWTEICTGLRASERLEQLQIGGGNLTDAALAALANHPRLRVLTIDENHVTSGCGTTFSSMPRLKTLVIRQSQRGNCPPLTWPEKDSIVAALPGVDVVFRK
jgi:hypothetical protein